MSPRAKISPDDRLDNGLQAGITNPSVHFNWAELELELVDESDDDLEADDEDLSPFLASETPNGPQEMSTINAIINSVFKGSVLIRCLIVVKVGALRLKRWSTWLLERQMILVVLSLLIPTRFLSLSTHSLTQTLSGP